MIRKPYTPGEGRRALQTKSPTEQPEANHDTVASAKGSEIVVVQAAPTRGATWVIAVSLVVMATCLVLRLDSWGGATALAQPVSRSGARGIFAFCGQLSQSTFGVFMVDVDTSTLWCYEVLPGKPLLKLVAARSWKYDRYLEEYNIDPDTSPAVIEEMVEQQRQRRLQSAGGP